MGGMRCITSISVLLMVAGIGACGKNAVIKPEPSDPKPTPTASAVPTPTPTASAVPSPTPIPTAKPVTGVRFTPVAYYTTVQERAIIKKAGDLVNETMRSDCVQKFIRNRKMIDTEGRTSDQVMDHLLSLTSEVPVKMYYRCMRNWKCPFGTSAVAYRQPPQPDINLNQAVYWSGLPLCEWASVMAHEGYGHSAGEYGHDYEWSPSREFSVPYSLNHAFTACCKEPK